MTIYLITNLTIEGYNYIINYSIFSFIRKIFRYNIPFKIKLHEVYPTLKLPEKEKICNSCLI